MVCTVVQVPAVCERERERGGGGGGSIYSVLIGAAITYSQGGSDHSVVLRSTCRYGRRCGKMSAITGTKSAPSWSEVAAVHGGRKHCSRVIARQSCRYASWVEHSVRFAPKVGIGKSPHHSSQQVDKQ